MKEIWIVYREYYDWDAHAKDNVLTTTNGDYANLIVEELNELHEKWCKLCNRTRNKRRRTVETMSELLTEAEDMRIIERLCEYCPEYDKRWGVDSRFSYSVESVKLFEVDNEAP